MRFVDVLVAERRLKRRGKFRPRNPAGIIDWKPPAPLCAHCGKPGAHFAPPSLGEPGYYICKGSADAVA